jgi:hypothetical protein
LFICAFGSPSSVQFESDARFWFFFSPKKLPEDGAARATSLAGILRNLNRLLFSRFLAGWPDQANFPPFGRLFYLSSFLKIIEEVQNFRWIFFHILGFSYYFDKKYLGYILGDFVHKNIWSPWFLASFALPHFFHIFVLTRQ